MTPKTKLKLARQRHSAATRALSAVRPRRMVGVGTPRLVRFGSTSTPVWDKMVDLNAAERSRLCRRSNRLLGAVDMISQRYNLSLAL